MKTLITAFVACCAVLVPISQAKAAEPAAKKYGDFKPGDSFTLKVTVAAPIGTRPAGFPLFRVGQKVKFTIGAKGQLTGPGFSINFEPKGSTKHFDYYDNATPSTHTLVHQADIKTKGNPAKPIYINLALRKQVGFTAYQASYVFN